MRSGQVQLQLSNFHVPKIPPVYTGASVLTSTLGIGNTIFSVGVAMKRSPPSNYIIALDALHNLQM